MHTSVRLSVTDRCNIRCFYCMPEADAQFVPRDRLLSFEELHRLSELLVRRGGISDIRITGGEPLVRRQLDRLIEMLAKIDGLEDLSFSIGGSYAGFSATAIFHSFEANSGGRDFGDELDLVISHKLGKRYSAMLKYADYDADDFATDTKKTWLMLSGTF